MAYETPLTIAEIVNDISANKYVLPSIQREFVWGTPQIERLFDSIMQGYPIGTFLFWELTNEQITSYTFYSFLQNYHEKNGGTGRSAEANFNLYRTNGLLCI